jgi:hypothetical protein
MKLIGILLVFNSLAVSSWWITVHGTHKGAVLTLCFLAVFAGIALVVSDRITEVSMKGVGTIKAAAEQASADANEISALKNRVEAQSATVDLIAKDSASTLDQLRSIACTNAEAALTDSMASNFMGGVDLKTRLDLNDRIINSLIEIGVSEDNIRNAKKMWSKGICVIYHRGIRNALEGRTSPNKVNMEVSPELRKASSDFQEMLNFSQWEAPSPDEMESFINEKGFMNDTVKELINDYRYFLKTGNIQRRSVFEKL